MNITISTIDSNRHHAEKIEESLIKAGLHVVDDGETIVSVGGDGTFLKALHKYGFSKRYVGINTGHLGFLPDLLMEDLDRLISALKGGTYQLIEYPVLNAAFNNQSVWAFNDIVLKASNSKTMHIHVNVNKIPLQKFAGDGLIISTPLGSSAYNYSAGGALLPPDSRAYQITPLAPLNTNAYRSLTSSFVVPAYQISTLDLEPSQAIPHLVVDGEEIDHEPFDKISFRLGPDVVKLLRIADYDFWARVKEKFLG